MKKILDYKGDEITEDEAKKSACIEYKYDDPKEALVDLIIDNETRKFHWETIGEIRKITKPVIHKGINLDVYIIWGKHMFINLMGFYRYVGKISE